MKSETLLEGLFMPMFMIFGGLLVKYERNNKLTKKAYPPWVRILLNDR